MAVDGLIFWVLMLIGGFVVLIKASDTFTDAAEKVGEWIGIPSFMVGVTIVAIGTSLPELASSILAVMAGAPEIVPGNVIGSNIANILLVLGVVAILARKLEISWELIKIDLPLLVGSAIILAFTCMDGVFTMPEALVCLAGYVVYIAYTSKVRKDHLLKLIEEKIDRPGITWKTIVALVVSVLFVYFGARLVIDSTLAISGLLGVGAELIALTALAIGTSLPELTVSIVAVRKGRSEMAVGNILGSNIFNVFAVMGVVGLFGSLVIPQTLIISLLVMVAATLMYFFVTQDKEVTKWEGWMLILIYAVFLIGVLGFGV